MPVLIGSTSMTNSGVLEMSSDQYKGLAKSEKFGCVAGGCIGVCTFLLLFGIDAIGDCAPDTSCTKNLWLNVLIPSIVITVLTYFLMRWVVNARSR